MTLRPTKKGVILLSGGLDSTTVLAIATTQGYACHCLSFRYGQKQSVELERARHIATTYAAAQHLILDLDLEKIGGSALTTDEPVPKDRDFNHPGDEIPVTYVPARNMIFLAHAVAWAEVIGASDIFIGVNAVDYSGYPDCRPEFLTAFTSMANLGTRAGITGTQRFTIHAPLLRMSKKEIIEQGLALGVDYGVTHSCYEPQGGKACGHCDACLLRRQGFVEADAHDPTIYAGER